MTESTREGGSPKDTAACLRHCSVRERATVKGSGPMDSTAAGQLAFGTQMGEREESATTSAVGKRQADETPEEAEPGESKKAGSPRKTRQRSEERKKRKAEHTEKRKRTRPERIMLAKATLEQALLHPKCLQRVRRR